MLVDCSLERVRGIEPPSSAWEAAALPLSYTREMARSAMERGWASTRMWEAIFPLIWEFTGKIEGNEDFLAKMRPKVVVITGPYGTISLHKETGKVWRGIGN
jgi:hypothetical protein